jgi:hypothetical protein
MNPLDETLEGPLALVIRLTSTMALTFDKHLVQAAFKKLP